MRHHTGEVSAGLQCPAGQPASQDVVQLGCGVGSSTVAGVGDGAVLDCTPAWHQVHCCAPQVSPDALLRLAEFHSLTCPYTFV